MFYQIIVPQCFLFHFSNVFLESNSKKKFSIESIKERFTKCFGNAKSWLETKVIGQVSKYTVTDSTYGK